MNDSTEGMELEVMSKLSKMSAEELGGLEKFLKEKQPIPEMEILIACVKWLNSRNVHQYQVSVARGSGINTQDCKSRLRDELKQLNIDSVNFAGDGPDVIGFSASEYWQIECKGFGSGKKQTQRNNFDRALASVVSYCVDVPPKGFVNAQPHLGLALPKVPDYVSELRRRVGGPLRRRLNLWVLLYEPESKQIIPVAPSDNSIEISNLKSEIL